MTDEDLAGEGSWGAAAAGASPGGGGAGKTRQPRSDIAASDQWTTDPVPCATHYLNYIGTIWTFLGGKESHIEKF